jgi:hypothetical protein
MDYNVIVTGEICGPFDSATGCSAIKGIILYNKFSEDWPTSVMNSHNRAIKRIDYQGYRKVNNLNNSKPPGC